jgi:hypothetical protein
MARKIGYMVITAICGVIGAHANTLLSCLCAIACFVALEASLYIVRHRKTTS